MANQIAYGFMNLKDRLALPVSTVGPRVVNDAILVTLAEYNRQLNELLDLFVRPVNEAQLRYRTAGAARLQPLDENGRARPIKPNLGYYDVAWPIYMAGGAWGATFLERQKMTVEDANNTINTLITADRVWVRDKILSALFAATSWQVDDEDYGTLTIQPIANGDATPYPYWSAGVYGATDNHLMAQAAAIADGANPFPAIRTELTEHPDNTGQVISFVPSNLVASVMALTEFHDYADPNLSPALDEQRIVGSPGLPNMPGTLLGYLESKVWIVEWPILPDNYIVSITTGGERPLGMRQDEDPALRGFFQAATREDHPFWEAQYIRRAGFGAWNRTAAVITRIGNAAYAAPADYSLPAL